MSVHQVPEMTRTEKLLLMGLALRQSNCGPKIKVTGKGEPSFGPVMADAVYTFLYDECEPGNELFNLNVRQALSMCGYGTMPSKARKLMACDKSAMVNFVNECAPEHLRGRALGL